MNKPDGFTLIEVIIYLALFGILMGGVSTAVYAIVEGGGRSQSKILIQEEGNFLLGKFNWALSGASNINVSPSILSIVKYSYSSNPLAFDISGTELRLKQGSGTINNLNSDDVTIKNLIFEDIPKSNGKPEGLVISFTLTSLASNGSVESEDFKMTKYLAQ